MVSDVDADDPSVSVTCGGVKLQAAPAGRPEHANATVPAKPHLDVTCIASGEEAEPLATVIFVADGASVRSGSLA